MLLVPSTRRVVMVRGRWTLQTSGLTTGETPLAAAAVDAAGSSVDGLDGAGGSCTQ